MESDAATFFDTDIPALLEWQFTAADAVHITAPVLYVGGTDSGPLFAEVTKLMKEWLPQADEVVIMGADHALAVSHPAEIAAALATFLQRHNIRSRPTSGNRDHTSDQSPKYSG
jgi:pimeloyl-ACP methyl ester carboxylesterase